MKYVKFSLLPTAAIMLNFPDAATVKKVVHCLPRVGVGTNFGLPQTRYELHFISMTLAQLVWDLPEVCDLKSAIFLLGLCDTDKKITITMV